MPTEPQPRVLPPGQRNQKDNIKKVAVTRTGKAALFLELDQNRPLTAVVKDICQSWDLNNADDFALQCSESNRSAYQYYITEKTRDLIQNGDLLVLTDSPAKTADNIYQTLKEGKSEDKYAALDKIGQLAADYTFAIEFINRQGHQYLIKLVVDGKLNVTGYANALKGFSALMEHSVVSWDVLELDFVKRVTDSILNEKSLENPGGQTTLALRILQNIASHCNDPAKVQMIEKYVFGNHERVHSHLQKHILQNSSLALLNALFARASRESKKVYAKLVQSKKFRNIISTYVSSDGKQLGSEMVNNLYCLQTHMLNINEERMNMPADPADPQVKRGLEVLQATTIAREDNPNQPGFRKSNFFKLLGFEDPSNPASDFAKHTPPGLLALDNVVYFAEKHQENYNKIVLENSTRADEHDCPFMKASIMLTKILCDILKIGEQPEENRKANYYPMFFSHEEPFKELFCVCIQLLNKTWREMRASTEDFPKVLNVVKEQLTLGLKERPFTIEQFRLKLNQLTYSEIIKLWEKERQNKEETESQAPPIVELRKHITPEILDLIKQQRLNYLMEGTKFEKSSKGRQRGKDLWLWKLSPNQKALHYADCSEQDILSLEQMPNKLMISDIKTVLIGKDCPHVKTKKSSTTPLVFSIQPQSNSTENAECFNFTAKDEVEYDMWRDGLNILMGLDMSIPANRSSQMGRDLDLLLNMEIKIRMLDADGITIPMDPPEIPPAPDNFNFATPDL